MLKQILFSFSFFSLFTAQAQTASFKKPVYAGGLNEIQFELKGYPCNEIMLTTSNGNLEKEIGCWHNYTPKDTGYTVITVNLKAGKKLKKIDSLILFIKEPTACFFIGPTRGGLVRKHVFEVNEYARVESFDFSCAYYYPFTIDSFFVEIMRDTVTIFQKWNFGNALSNELKSAFNQLKANDNVVISNITGQTLTGRRKIETKTIYTIQE